VKKPLNKRLGGFLYTTCYLKFWRIR